MYMYLLPAMVWQCNTVDQWLSQVNYQFVYPVEGRAMVSQSEFKELLYSCSQYYRYVIRKRAARVEIREYVRRWISSSS
jgi:hypothetical protein